MRTAAENRMPCGEFSSGARDASIEPHRSGHGIVVQFLHQNERTGFASLLSGILDMGADYKVDLCEVTTHQFLNMMWMRLQRQGRYGMSYDTIRSRRVAMI